MLTEQTKHRIEDPLHDVTTLDGVTTSLKKISDELLEADVEFLHIQPWFIGFQIDKESIFFNGKSVLAQIGVNIVGREYEICPIKRQAKVRVEIRAIGAIAKAFLPLITLKTKLGKLFAKDDRRRVQNPDYIIRMFGRSDRWGRPLLSLGAMHGSDELVLDTIDGRAVAYLSLLNGRVGYDATIFGFLPTIVRALEGDIRIRELLQLHQIWIDGASKNAQQGEILLVKTLPLHIRTVFAHVVDDLLSTGYTHTTASILQPDTTASGDIYELIGSVHREITDIPLEFYTLEPYREHVFFTDRTQLRKALEDYDSLNRAFKNAPEPNDAYTATFVVKSQQLESLQESDWIVCDPYKRELPGIVHGTRQAMLVERFLEQQPSYPFLKAIESGYITSQGVLLCRYLPPPAMKRMLLSEPVSRCLKGLYFKMPSKSTGEFFSNEDRSLLNDLSKFGIPVFWVDDRTKRVLQYIQKPNREIGMFVPAEYIDTYLKSTVFGVYGSNLVAGPFEENLHDILAGVIEMKESFCHPLLNRETPIALVTGGGPGAMELANRLAKELGILSCANIADFRLKSDGFVNEQLQNRYIDAKMTYRLAELVERQAEFNLDFPIFVQGGIGTDFEYCLEEVRRKVGCIYPTPVLLFGDVEYWKSKITDRYQCNLSHGTIKGSEWISGCFFCVQTAEEGLHVYRKFFEGTLRVGKEAQKEELGFVINVLETV